MSPPAWAHNSGQRSGARQLLLLRSPLPLAAAPTLPSWLFASLPPDDLLRRRVPSHDPGSLSPSPRHGRTSGHPFACGVAAACVRTAGETPAWKGKGRPPGLFHENETTAAPGEGLPGKPSVLLPPRRHPALHPGWRWVGAAIPVPPHARPHPSRAPEHGLRPSPEHTRVSYQDTAAWWAR